MLRRSRWTKPAPGDRRGAGTSQLAGEHGAVLVRGRPWQPEEFDAVVSALGYPNFSYANSLSNAYRINHTPRVFSANEAPASHHLSAPRNGADPILSVQADLLRQVAAGQGGATPVCRSDILWERLASTGCSRRIAKPRGRYTNVMPGEADTESGMGRSWQSTPSVDSRKAAEALGQAGYTWNGRPTVTCPSPPCVSCRAPPNQWPLQFFHQLIAASKVGRTRATTRRERSVLAMAAR